MFVLFAKIKKKMINVCGKLEEKVKDLVDNKLVSNLSDERLPKVLCAACKLCIYEGSKIRGKKIIGSDEKIFYKLDDSIKKLLSSRLDLRSQADVKCNCTLCDLVKCDPEKIVNLKNKKNSYDNFIKNKENIKKKKGSVIKSTIFKQKKEDMKRCYKCCTQLSKGIKHVCTTSTLLNNITTDLLKDKKKKRSR